MFRTIALASALLASAVAFTPAGMNARRSAHKLAMSAEFLPGALAPLGYFDPLGFCAGKTEGEVKKIRESELKHGRVAMVAFVGIMVAESFNPLFEGKITGPAIYQYQQAENLVSFFSVQALFGTALVEISNILSGWESDSETNARQGKFAQLKKNYVNGDIGFDPLGLKPSDPQEFATISNKELNNGRLAMLAVAGIIAQELVNGKGVLENLL